MIFARKQSEGRLRRSLTVIALLLVVFLPPQTQATTSAYPPQPVQAAAAPIAILVDLSAGQTLFARNADRPFRPASMTKAMSALVAFDLIRAGRLDPAALVEVDADIAGKWAGKGTTLGLRTNERVTVDRLIEGMVTASANDASEVLARHAAGSRAEWVALMNRRAQSLGMNGSRFTSPSGWPDGGKTIVTARDMVRLARALIEEHPGLYRRYFGHPAMQWRGTSLASRNPFAGRLAGADGIKTGHTTEAGYNFLGSVERGGRRLILLVGGAPSETARARMAVDLAEWGFGAWNSRLLVRAGQVIGRAKVQGGASRSVELVALKDWRVAVPNGSSPRIATLRSPPSGARGVTTARPDTAFGGSEP